VILDPPAFAKSRDAILEAARGYKEINLRALRILKPGGCLVTCSCSPHPRGRLRGDPGRRGDGRARDGHGRREAARQARDHPVVLNMPEAYYLECFVLRRLE
jgi:23S rRNA (cytosine1962-C5)-methyltransferase